MISAPPSARPIQVSDASSVGEARRHATAVAEYCGLSGELLGNVSLIATELAVNLHLHGGGGELLVSPLVGTGVQMLAIDRGRGMDDIDRCLTDGYSTAGTAGQGLGAVRRLSWRFDVHSQPRTRQIGGTVILSQVRAQPEPFSVGHLEIGAVSVPLDGETVCGDGWATDSTQSTAAVLVVDGLGHGHCAAEAARAAITVFRSRGDADPTSFLTRAHVALRSTRGAAAAVAYIDLLGSQVRYAGIGNIAGRLVTEERSRSMISHNGTLGLQISRNTETAYPWLADGVLVMASDGLVTGWTIEGYRGLLRRHPAVIAAVLYRDWSRTRDDVTVVVARLPPASRPL